KTRPQLAIFQIGAPRVRPTRLSVCLDNLGLGRSQTDAAVGLATEPTATRGITMGFTSNLFNSKLLAEPNFKAAGTITHVENIGGGKHSIPDIIRFSHQLFHFRARHAEFHRSNAHVWSHHRVAKLGVGWQWLDGEIRTPNFVSRGRLQSEQLSI